MKVNLRKDVTLQKRKGLTLLNDRTNLILGTTRLNAPNLAKLRSPQINSRLSSIIKVTGLGRATVTIPVVLVALSTFWFHRVLHNGARAALPPPRTAAAILTSLSAYPVKHVPLSAPVTSRTSRTLEVRTLYIYSTRAKSFLVDELAPAETSLSQKSSIFQKKIIITKFE